ncbi:MAG: NADP-dependent phosphogluconate dehydrogenase [Pseudomonadota bacterium]
MAHLGLIGIGVMGSAFAQNLADNGHTVSLMDRDPARAAEVAAEGADLAGELIGCTEAEDFVASLPQPRSVIVLVPSGKPLDAVIDTLIPLLAPGDLIADLGNSYYKETELRVEKCEAAGLMFLGMGISGGAEGARHGPAIMAGGSRASWDRVKGPLQDASAKFEDDPCCDWYGPGGAGHFIKMLHNGIEYADMQMIAEVYGVFRDAYQMSPAEIGDVFEAWNDGPLSSYLIEIASEVSKANDPETGKAMLDIILDRAGQKGTGRWSVIEGLHLGAPVSMMQAAVEARNVSALKDDRAARAARWGAAGNPLAFEAVPKARAIQILGDALLVAKICAYDQGFGVLRRASEAFGWDLDLAAISRGWRAGCIIRSVLLDDISTAFEEAPNTDLVMSPHFEQYLSGRVEALQSGVAMCTALGLEVPTLYAAFSSFNAMRLETGTANMIQALRDRFGAHTFERIDRPGESVNGPWHE